MANFQAGWYADPSGDASKMRYWDGAQWTNNTVDAAAFSQPNVQPVAQSVPQHVQQVQPVQPAQPYQATYQASNQVPYHASNQAPYQAPYQAQQHMGTAQYVPQSAAASAAFGESNPSKGKKAGIVALILGIIGFILAIIPVVNFFAYPLVIVGIILGIVSRLQAKGGKGPKGAATAGIIISTIALVVTIIMSILVAMATTVTYSPHNASGIVSINHSIACVDDSA